MHGGPNVLYRCVSGARGRLRILFTPPNRWHGYLFVTVMHQIAAWWYASNPEVMNTATGCRWLLQKITDSVAGQKREAIELEAQHQLPKIPMRKSEGKSLIEGVGGQAQLLCGLRSLCMGCFQIVIHGYNVKTEDDDDDGDDGELSRAVPARYVYAINTCREWNWPLWNAKRAPSLIAAHHPLQNCKNVSITRQAGSVISTRWK